MMGKLLERLNDASRSGVYRSSRAEPILDALRGAQLELSRIDARDSPVAAIARALEFPRWFGGNWDALEDSLSDLSWRAAKGQVLLFETFPEGKDLDTLLEVLRSSAEFWSARARPFFAVLIDPRRSLSLPDLFRQA
jgi:hypothetical protein